MLDFKVDKTALIIVDMQNDFVREGAPMQVKDALLTVKPIQNLIKTARKSNMPIIFTKFVAGPKKTLIWNWSPEIESDKCCFRNYKRIYKDTSEPLECTDIISELKPDPLDYIVEKYGYSAFRNTNLIDILYAEHRDSVIVTGTVTQICVADTVHDAFHFGLKVLVSGDGVSSFSKTQHEAALENMEMKYAIVSNSDEIIARFIT